MKHAVRTHTYGGQKWDKYDIIMAHFSKKFFHSDNVKVGEKFVKDLGKYLDRTKYPCDKMIINCFTGYSDRFSIIFNYKDERVSWIEIKVENYGILLLYNKSYDKKDFAIFHNILEEYFDKYNQQILNEWLKKCNITNNNTIEIENYVDYKITNTNVLNGTIEEIFDKYTTINDTYKYCNGHYVRFKDDNVKRLYNIFVTCYKGNYFLDNAVKRGVLID